MIKRGQSLNHICTTHADKIKVSEKTLYNYIDACAFEVRNIDLPKKVKYRRRREKKVLTKFGTFGDGVIGSLTQKRPHFRGLDLGIF